MGHYAVGLAVAFPQTPVYAFDISAWAREMTRKTSSKNDADNIRVLSECTSDWLAENLSPEALIISDCEGCEFDLLAPNAVPALRKSTLVVELHGESDQTSSLVDRFSTTHSCSLIEYQHPDQSAERNPDAHPELDGFSESERNMAVSDLRGKRQTWLYAVPK
jgi:precorrin-6B methylase 2